MKFDTFNLVSHIRAYNTRTKKNIELSESFDLLVFDPHTTKMVVDAISLIESCHLTYSGVSDIASKCEFSNEIKDNMIHNQFVAVKKSLQKIRVNNQLSKAHQWYCHQQERLSDSKVWEGLINAGENSIVKEKIRVHWINWTKHQALSHYPSAALWFVASQALMLIETYHQVANKELSYRSNRRKLPSDILKAYKKYLSELKKSIDKAREELCHAMLARLSVAAETKDIYYDDVTMFLAEDLLRLKVMKCENGFLRQSRRGLNGKLIGEFHNYIEKFGSIKQKEALSHLRWFRENSNFSVLTLSRTFLVPKDVAELGLVPRYVFSKWLFRRRWYRKHFYQQHQGLMLRLRMLPRVNMKNLPQSPERLDQFFSDLNQVFTDLDEADKGSNAWIATGLWGLFHRSTNQFITLWQGFAEQQRRHVLERKMDMMIAIRRHVDFSRIKTQNTRSFITNQFASRLMTHFHDIGQQLEKIEINAGKLKPYNQSKVILSQLCNGVLMLEKRDGKPPLALKVSSESVLSPPILPNASTHSEIPMVAIQSHFFNGKSKAKGNVSKEMLNTVKSEGVLSTIRNLDLMAVSDAVFNSVMTSLKQAAIDIDRTNQDQSVNAMHHALQHLFICYLQQARKINSEHDFEQLSLRFNAVESLLSHQFVPDHISLRVQQLIDMRLQPNWVLTFNLQAEAFLASYASNKVECNDGQQEDVVRVVSGGVL